MKKIGLWVSKKTTVLVLIINTKINIHHVNDNYIECNNPTQSKSINNFSKTTPSQNTTINIDPQVEYFEHIINYLSGAKRILIVGPDGTPETLYNYLRNTNINLCNCVCNVKHMDYMLDPKIAKYFINFFSSNNEKRES